MNVSRFNSFGLEFSKFGFAEKKIFSNIFLLLDFTIDSKHGYLFSITWSVKYLKGTVLNRTVFYFSILYKSSLKIKCMRTKDVYSKKKRQLILKTPRWVYSKYRCNEKSFFYENVLGKKSQKLKTQDFISSYILSYGFRKLELYCKSFYFQVFFPEIFSGDFLT